LAYAHCVSRKSGRTIIVFSIAKSRLAWRTGAILAAVAASGTLGISAASASTYVMPLGGIAVPGDSAGAPAVLVASLEGRNEVTGGTRDGQALALIGLQGNTLSYTIRTSGIIGIPTQAAIHAGGPGVDGPVVVPLFTTASPAGVGSGTVTVTDPAVLDALRSNPGGFYADLSTAIFPGGAARAQLHLLNHTVSTSGVAAVQESVVLGSQIYACTAQADGSFAFTQDNVDAHLTGGIHHTFVQHGPAGPPQWQAPDGSAVTGALVTKNANGAGNIAELNLNATQIGGSAGLLAHVVEVLRLNTVGGVAPAGSCDPQATPTVHVPYHADYVFING
jgi:hypothetical protein